MKSVRSGSSYIAFCRWTSSWFSTIRSVIKEHLSVPCRSASGLAIDLCVFCCCYYCIVSVTVASFFFFFGGTEDWTQGLRLEPLLQPFFMLGIFEMGSCELFAQTDLQPRFSWSLPPGCEPPEPSHLQLCRKSWCQRATVLWLCCLGYFCISVSSHNA
jgi:hypothetical protein